MLGYSNGWEKCESLYQGLKALIRLMAALGL